MFSQEQWGQLLANFIEEAKELIQQAEAALLELDDGHGIWSCSMLSSGRFILSRGRLASLPSMISLRLPIIRKV